MQRLQTGDLVIVTHGNDKGRQGRITKLIAETDKVVVAGVNVVKKHVKATAEKAGGILEVEAPLAASNVMPVDPETGKATRVRFADQDGKKVRLAKSGAAIVAQR